MKKPLPALVAAAFGVLALTGCSIHGSAAADLGGGPGGRSPMLQSGSAETTVGHVTVTSLSQADFEDQRHDGSKCVTEADATYCQQLRVVQGQVQWTAYFAVPPNTDKASMDVGSADGFHASTVVTDLAPYVKVTWDSPSIPKDNVLSTDVQISLHDGTVFDANNYSATYENGWYSEDELVLE